MYYKNIYQKVGWGIHGFIVVCVCVCVWSVCVCVCVCVGVEGCKEGDIIMQFLVIWWPLYMTEQEFKPTDFIWYIYI